jgi:hypothetical protein
MRRKASPLGQAQLFIYNTFRKYRGRVRVDHWKKLKKEANPIYGKIILARAFTELVRAGKIQKVSGTYWWPDIEKASYKTAKANVQPVRQRTQFTCMSTSMMMCLRANGLDCTEDEVNKVMGARPMKGAAWEDALACAQHYGMRATLTCPSTVKQLKEWTDRGVPVMIAWNPEGRDWSHASVVFDVDDDFNVYVADPNIPDPDETVRVVPKSEFYSKWSEKWPNYLVRRPACAIEREITTDGRQVMASDQLGSARDDYMQAVTNLEASVDMVAVATNKLRSLGHEPRDEDYPFMEDIEVVASDVYRWRGEVDRKYETSDHTRVAHRVAQKHIRKTKP